MEEIVQPIMESEIIENLGGSYTDKRLREVEDASEMAHTDPELEAETIQKGIAETVKDLEKETQETFPNKEDVAESETLETPQEMNDTAKSTPASTEQQKILGMKPVVFLVVAALAIGGGIMLYRKYKKA